MSSHHLGPSAEQLAAPARVEEPARSSRHRISPRAGHVRAVELPRGPEGRALCRQCGQEVPRGRRSFCSEGCVHHWRLRSDPNYVREHVFRRDRGVCAHCGTDTEAQRRAFRPVPARKRRAWVAERSIPWGRRFGRWWDADHVVPVAEGGGECDLTNYQTLCLPCHRQKTTQQARRRTTERQQAQRAVLDTITYTYRGDRLTAPELKGATCQAVRRPDGKCIRGRNGAMLVRLPDGTQHVVLGRQLRKSRS